MIAYLEGTVAHISHKELVVNVQGVGYAVRPTGELRSHAKMGEILKMWVTTIVRETEITLYGFDDYASKKLFDTVLAVSGIGPKVGLSIADTPPQIFYKALEEGDITALKKIPGLGPKTAQRMVLELKGKLHIETEEAKVKSRAMEEAAHALVNLGYDQKTVMAVLSDAPEDVEAEDLIRYFLTTNV